jgi:type I restriction enzyme, S subunit
MKAQKVKFGDFVEVGKDNEYEPIKNGLTNYVAGEHLESKLLHITRFGDIEKSKDVIGSAFHRKFLKGQVLFGTRRAYLRKTGIVTFDGICSNTTLVLNSKQNGLVDGLLPFIVRLEKFTEHAVKRSVGSTNPYVRWRDLADFEFVLPSEKEQLQIKETLWSIQNSIDCLDKLIQKTQKYYVSKRESLLTKGIGHKNFKKIPWLYEKEIEIPKSWENKTFDELFEFLITGSNPRSDLEDTGDIQYIHYGDIHQKWKYFLDCDSDEIPYISKTKVKNLPLLKEDDIVLVDASEDYEGSGASVLLKNVKNKKIVAGLHTIALRNIEESVSLDFQAFLTSMPFVKNQIISYVNGISVYGLSKKDLKKIKIPLPSLPEQEKISQILLSIYKQILEQQSHLTNLYSMQNVILNSKFASRENIN